LKLVSLLFLINVMAISPSSARGSQEPLNSSGQRSDICHSGTYLASDDQKENKAEKAEQEQKKTTGGDQPLKRRGAPGALPPPSAPDLASPKK
jgi:hypothetical protein